MIGFLASLEAYRQHLRPVAERLDDVVWVETPHAFTRQRVAPHADIWITAAERDHAVVRRLGTPTVFMEHGCGLEWFQPARLANVMTAAAIAAPHEHAASRYRAARRGVPVTVVGTPKMDQLLQVPRPQGTTVAVAFHWSGVRRQRRAVWWSYRRALRQLAAVVPVIGHAHPRVATESKAFYGTLGIEWVPSLTEVVARATVYAVDAGSTLYEWAALGRPAVALDRPPGLLPCPSGLAPVVGPTATPDTLVATVADVLRCDRWAAQRLAATAELYPYLGRATDRMLQVIHDTRG